MNEAVEECFLEDNKILTTDILLEIVKNTKCIANSCKHQLEDMEVLFDENDFTNASKSPYWILTPSERDSRKRTKHNRS